MVQKSPGKGNQPIGKGQNTSGRSGLESILNKYPYHNNLDQLVQQYIKKMGADDPSRYELINPIANTAMSLSKVEGGKALENQTRAVFAAYETAHRGDGLTKDIENNMIGYLDSLLGKFRENVKANIKGEDLRDLLPLIFLNKDIQNNLPEFYKNLMSLPYVKDSNLGKNTAMFHSLTDEQKDPKQRLIDYFGSLSAGVIDSYMKRGHTKDEADKIVGSAKKAYESIINGADSSTLNLLITEASKELQDAILTDSSKIDPASIERTIGSLPPNEYTNIARMYQMPKQR
ncbi:MAG: hypothetical protein QXK90_00645 [Candidatus Parvarchaeota archaeon]